MASTLLYVISPITIRSDKRTTFHALMEGNKHVVGFLPSSGNQEFPQIKEKNFIIINETGLQPQQGNRPAQLFMTTKSIIFETQNTFDVDESKVQEILNPPEVSISEAKNSPKKRKVSVTAEVSEVNTLIDRLDKKGNPYKLRCLTLKDPATTTTVRCKLWGDYAEKDISTATTYTFKNVEVDDSSRDGQLDIQTTDLTQILAKRSASPVNQIHEIIGLHRRDNMLILLDRKGEVVEVPMNVFDSFEPYNSIEDFKAALPLELKLTTTGADGIISAMAKI